MVHTFLCPTSTLPSNTSVHSLSAMNTKTDLLINKMNKIPKHYSPAFVLKNEDVTCTCLQGQRSSYSPQHDVWQCNKQVKIHQHSSLLPIFHRGLTQLDVLPGLLNSSCAFHLHFMKAIEFYHSCQAFQEKFIAFQSTKVYSKPGTGTQGGSYVFKKW